jgi:hypothetical protein
MKVPGAFLGILLVASLAHSQPTEWNACAVCNYLMGEIEKQTQSATTRDEIIAVLDSICPAIASFMDSNKCESFMHVFGDETVDLLLRKATAATICKDGLQICPSSGPVNYEVLFPTVIGNDLSYEAIETNFDLKTQFHYKIFLGDAFPESNHLKFDLGFSNCEMSFAINSVAEHSNQSCNSNCSTVVEYPDTTSWYKVDVVPTKIVGSPTKLHLQILFSRVDHDLVTDTLLVGYSAWWVIFPVLTVLPLFIGCCCMLAIRKFQRRTCRGYRCRSSLNKETTPQPLKEPAANKDSVEIPMEPVPPPSESYYYPQQNANVTPAPPSYPVFWFPQQPQYTPFQVQPPRH